MNFWKTKAFQKYKPKVDTLIQQYGWNIGEQLSYRTGIYLYEKDKEIMAPRIMTPYVNILIKYIALVEECIGYILAV